MRTRNLERIILKMFGDKEFYGYEVHKRLESEDFKIEISRLYRVLNGMLSKRLLEGRWEKSHLGPKRRLYRIDRKGKEELHKMLLDAIKTVHSFYGKYLMNLPIKVNPIDSICSSLTDEMKGQGKIAYVASRPSGMHKRVIHALHKNVPEDTIYFVKPSSVTVKMNLDYLAFLDGAYSNIPMKNCYFDLLVVIGLPKWNRLEAMVRECHRVSKQNGRLAILTPTFLISSYEDPLTIGEFVEKYEHETIRKDEQQFGKAFIQEMLRKYFKKVAESHIVHMTIFIASEPCSLRQ